MAAKTGEIRYGWDRPVPIPTEFLLTEHYTERTTVADKREGVSHPGGNGFGSAMSFGYSVPAYFIFVMTAHGDLRVCVSKEVYRALHIGDTIVVRYQCGRWTGSLKGRIAR